jgi:hypothetical protein
MVRRAMLAVAVTLAVGCGDDGREPAPPPVAAGVSGPLCDLLPAGDDPGAPATLVDEPVGVALTWIPVLTTFEAAVRASGTELRDVTVLAPTDDAFAAAYDRRRLDEVLLSPARARELVEAHVVDGALSLAQLLQAGEVTTRAGATLGVSEAGGQARLGDRARTVCADYAVADAYIHVIDGVLP